MIKAVRKRFDIQAVQGGTVSQTFELEKTIVAIKGLLITSERDDLLYYQGTQRIEINKEEIFPEGYESKLLMSGINVPPSHRYFDMGKASPGNGQVKIEYTDTTSSQIALAAEVPNYRVSLYLDCEMED